MATLPLRSPGVLSAPLDGRAVLYDLVAEVVHVVSPSAAVLWAACDGAEDDEVLAAEVAAVTGVGLGQVRSDLQVGLRDLTRAGLVGRRTPPPALAPTAAVAAPGRHRTAVLAVLDEGVSVRSDDRELVTAVDRLLAPLAVERPVSVVLGVAPGDAGTWRVTGHGPARTHPSMAALLEALPSALNLVAAATSSCLALHAGCVRSPAGEVVVLPAESGAGKTTLTAALVQAGWAYASDEAAGVRAGSLLAVGYPKPLVLDVESRRRLGLADGPSSNVQPGELSASVEVLVGDVGPVDRVVLPCFVPGAAVELSDPLAPEAAVVALVEHALNLARAGEPGLAAACELAQRVPVQRLVHGGVALAVAALGGRRPR